MKFLCLAYEEESALKNLPRDEWLALRQETLDYVDALRNRGILLDARPLRSASTASVVRIREGESRVTDGPFAETKEQLGGFFLIEVENREAALRVAAEWPSARIGSVEVRPVDEELSTESRY